MEAKNHEKDERNHKVVLTKIISRITCLSRRQYCEASAVGDVSLFLSAHSVHASEHALQDLAKAVSPPPNLH